VTRFVLPPKKAYRAPFLAPKDGGRILVKVKASLPVSTHVLAADANERYSRGERKIDSLASMPNTAEGATFADVPPGSRFFLLIESESNDRDAEVEFHVKQRRTVKGYDFWLDE
jgi:hypothetical protein